MIEQPAIPALVMSAVALSAGLNRLVVYVRQRTVENLSFSLSCLVFCVYAYASGGLYAADNPWVGGEWQRLQYMTLGFLAPGLLWFFMAHTGRMNHRLLVVLGAPCMALGLINGMVPGEWGISATTPDVKSVALPWGMGFIQYQEMKSGYLTVMQFVAGFAVLFYGWWVVASSRRNGCRSRNVYLYVALLVFSASAILDGLIGQGLLLFPYTMEYGYFALIVFMSVQGADDVARAGEMREHYEIFVNSSPSGICKIRLGETIRVQDQPEQQVEKMMRSARVTECNQAMLAMLALTSESEVLTNQPVMSWLKLSGTAYRDMVTRFIEGGYRIDNYETREEGLAGRTHWFMNQMQGHVERDELRYVWATKRDITALKEAAEKLEASEERYRAYIQQSSEGIWRLEINPPVAICGTAEEQVHAIFQRGRLEEGNQALARMFGVESPERVLVNGVHGLFPMSDRDTEGLFHELVESGFQIRNYHVSIPSPDVRTREGMEGGKALICNMHGVVTDRGLARIWGMFRDVTPLHRAYQKLQQEDLKYQALLENTGTLMGIIDDDMRMVYVNAEWTRFTGYEKTRIEGRMSITEFVPVEDRPLIEKNHRNRREQPELAPRSYEIRMKKGDGQVVPALATVSMIPGTRRSIISLIDVSLVKAVEAELRDSRTMLQLILDHVPQRIFWKNPDSILMGCNAGFARDFGLNNTADIVGKTDYDITSNPAEAEYFRACDREVWASGKPLLKITETYTDALGVVHYLETNKVPIYDDQGRPYKLLGTYEDVTGRVLGMERLRISEGNFRALFDRMSEGLAIFNVVTDEQGEPCDLVFAEMNPAFSALTGFQQASMEGKSLDEMTGPEGNALGRRLLDVAVSGHSVTVHYVDERTRRHYACSAYTPQPDRLAVLFRDVTEEERLNRMVKENEARFRSVVEGTREGIFILQVEKHDITYVNPAMIRMFGYDAKGMSVIAWPSLFAGSSHRVIRRLIESAGKSRDAQSVNVTAIRRDQSRFTAELQLMAVSDATGRQAILGMLRDISELRMIEQAIVSASEREQQRLGRDLHDRLGQKLTGIKFIAGGLRARVAGQDDRELSRMAEDLEIHASSCIAEARKIATGLFPHVLDHCSIRHGLEELSKEISRLPGIHCHYQQQDPDPELASSAVLHLYRIAQEAANNALKHGNARQIVITLRIQARDVVLEVMDDGQGIDLMCLGGEGLGMKIMRHRAGMMNGTLEVFNGMKTGSVVRCTVPLEPAPQELNHA